LSFELVWVVSTVIGALIVMLRSARSVNVASPPALFVMSPPTATVISPLPETPATEFPPAADEAFVVLMVTEVPWFSADTIVVAWLEPMV